MKIACFLRLPRIGHQWLNGLLLALVLGIHGAEATQPLRVGFVCPAQPEQPEYLFWSRVIQAMQAAAEDLQIEFIVQCGTSNSTYVMKKKGNELLNAEPKLDYYLTSYWQSTTKEHFALAEQRGVKVITFSADVIAGERDQVGRPRERYKSWIGQMLPDEKKAAAGLAELLIERARKAGRFGRDEKVHVIGLGGGTNANDVAHMRNEGLSLQVAASQALLHEIVPAFWLESSARESTLELLPKYPHTAVIWAASDTMAWGAIEAVRKSGRKPGQDVFIGGIDWLSGSLPRLEDGSMSVSMGGQLLEGVWAMILAHDYHYGFDFADDTGVRILTPMHAITSENIGRYKVIFEDQYWRRIDFRRFSKKYNSQLKVYDFSFDQLVEQ